METVLASPNLVAYLSDKPTDQFVSTSSSCHGPSICPRQCLSQADQLSATALLALVVVAEVLALLEPLPVVAMAEVVDVERPIIVALIE